MHCIGIDVSKAHLDVALVDEAGALLENVRVSNARKTFTALMKQWRKSHGVTKDQCLVCLEPTGHYSYLILRVLLGLELPTWLAHPRDIQQSIGSTRGKNDRIDAQRIAEYARRFRDKARMFTADHLRLAKLKQLLTRRHQLVGDRTKHQKQIRDLNRHMEKDLQRTFDRFDKSQIRTLNKLINEVEAMILEEVASDPQLAQRYALLRSVPGVGPVLAANLLGITDGFSRFTSPRALACHAGVAPFEHSSGSTVRGKTRVSPHAHHSLKTLLHMSALGVVARPGELRDYWLRKVAEGKHKMAVLNAIRNKIIHRIYAVIKRGTPFQPTPLAHVIE